MNMTCYEVRKTRRFPSAGVWLAALLAAAPAGAATLTRGPYLQLLTPNSVTIVWNTDTPAACSLAIRPVSGSSTVIQGGTDTVCAVPVDGLTSGTDYAYTPFADGVSLDDESVFRTDDPSRSRYTFLLIGDSGSGGHNQLELRDTMLKSPVDFMIHTGDMIYEDGLAEDFNHEFFTPYRELIRHIVFWPTLGNHDVHPPGFGAPWVDAFYTPANNASGTEKHYSFDFGSAHVTVLDSNVHPIFPSSAQYMFLEHDLAASTALWKFVVFHYPIYSSGFHGSFTDLQSSLIPLFDKYGVDIVFNGHDHDYERTQRVTANQPAAPGTGVTYIVTGGGGKDAKPVASSWFTAYSESVLHFTRVTIDGTTLVEQMVRKDGTVGDTMTLVKGAPPPAPFCGDNLVNQPAEQCDGPDHTACVGACLPDCTCAPVCGDGHVNQPTEACDGSDDAACPGSCLSDCQCGDQSRFTTLAPVADTFIDAIDQGTMWDHGIAQQLKVDQRSAFAYVKFVVPPLPAPVTGARLILVANNMSPDGGTIFPVHDSTWLEGDRTGTDATAASGPGLKWVDVDSDGNGVVDIRDTSPYAPDFNDPVGGIGPVDIGGTFSADVTPAFKDGPGTYTFAIKNDSQNGTLYFSRETSQGPALRLELAASGTTSTTTPGTPTTTSTTTSTRPPTSTTSTTVPKTTTSTTTSSTTTTSTSRPAVTTTTLAGCDRDPAGCDDGDPCTTDSCGADHRCHHVALRGLEAVGCRVATLAETVQGMPPAAAGGVKQQRRLAARVRSLRAAVLAARSSRGRRAAVNLARAQRLSAALGRQVQRLESQGTLARPIAERMLALIASAEQELRSLPGSRGSAG